MENVGTQKNEKQTNKHTKKEIDTCNSSRTHSSPDSDTVGCRISST